MSSELEHKITALTVITRRNMFLTVALAKFSGYNPETINSQYEKAGRDVFFNLEGRNLKQDSSGDKFWDFPDEYAMRGFFHAAVAAGAWYASSQNVDVCVMTCQAAGGVVWETDLHWRDLPVPTP